MQNKKFLALTILAIVAALAAIFQFGGFADSGRGKDGAAPKSQRHENATERKAPGRKLKSATKETAKAKKKGAGKKKKSAAKRRPAKESAHDARLKREVAARNEVDPSLPPAEQKALRGLREALDGDNAESTIKYAEALRGSASAEVRSEAVSALEWFGSKSLGVLTRYLGDADEDVASEAQNAWEHCLSEIESDTIKLQYVEVAMSSLDKSSALESLAMNLNQADDEGAAVESIVRIIKSGNNAGAAKAIEAYEFITGESWGGREKALRWAAEHHPPPEDDPED